MAANRKGIWTDNAKTRMQLTHTPGIYQQLCIKHSAAFDSPLSGDTKMEIAFMTVFCVKSYKVKN